MGIFVLSLEHGSGLRGSDVYLHIAREKKKSRKFSLNSARVGALGWPLPVIFFFLGIFLSVIGTRTWWVSAASHLLGIHIISGLKYFL